MEALSYSRRLDRFQQHEETEEVLIRSRNFLRRCEMAKMRANVFRGKNDIRVEEVERPRAGVG